MEFYDGIEDLREVVGDDYAFIRNIDFKKHIAG